MTPPARCSVGPDDREDPFQCYVHGWAATVERGQVCPEQTEALRHDGPFSANGSLESSAAPTAQAGPGPGGRGGSCCSSTYFPSWREGRGVSLPVPLAPA